MNVRDIMTTGIAACTPVTNLAEAASQMWNNDCGMLPVLGDDGLVVGVVTDRDLCIALGTRNRPASDITAGDTMSGRVFSCRPDEDIHGALNTMKRNRVRRLVVVAADGGLEGVLSVDDVALHAQKGDGRKQPELSYQDVVETLKAICEREIAQYPRTKPAVIAVA